MSATIGDRIRVLKKVLDIKYNTELERGDLPEGERLLGNGVIASWSKHPVTYTSNKIEKFLIHYRINKDWWLTGKGEVFDTNPTKPAGKQLIIDTLERTVVGLRSDIAGLRADLAQVRKERDDLRKEVEMLRNATPANDV